MGVVNMFTFLHGDWHFWQGTALTPSFMASEESAKRLHSFPSVDDCINWLFVTGKKAEARALNAAWKARK